jgi:hypothetical protein
VTDVCLLLQSPHRPHPEAILLAHAPHEHRGYMMGDMLTRARQRILAREQPAALPAPTLTPGLIAALSLELSVIKPTQTPALAPACAFANGVPELLPLWGLFLRCGSEAAAVALVSQQNQLYADSRLGIVEGLVINANYGGQGDRE